MEIFMKRLIYVIVGIAAAVSAIAAIAYWLSYFFAASGKKFCFVWGNGVPSKIEDAARNAGACEEL